MKVKSESEVAQSCPTLNDPMDCSPPGSSVHGFARQEDWSGVPLPSPREALARCNTEHVNDVFMVFKEKESESEVTQSCPALSDPMDYSLPGSSVHGIFQARVLEWGAIAFSV